jgi:flagella basal body P-ring formation protein FlgA
MSPIPKHPRAALRLLLAYALVTHLSAWAGDGNVAGTALQDAAVAALRQTLVGSVLRATVEPETPVPAVTVPAGVVTLRPRASSLDGPLAPRMLVWLDVAVDGRLVRAVSVPVRVSAIRRVWTARSDLAAGTSLAEPMLALVEVDVTRAPGALVRPDLLARRTRLRHAVLAGQVLTNAMIEAMPEVVRGDWVNLRLDAGTVSVETRVQALQDGRLGQRVQIGGADGKSSMVALVAGPGQVRIADQ